MLILDKDETRVSKSPQDRLLWIFLCDDRFRATRLKYHAAPSGTVDTSLNLLLKTDDVPTKALLQALDKSVAAKYVSVFCCESLEAEIKHNRKHVQYLISLQPSGNVVPWIQTSEQEVCQQQNISINIIRLSHV